MNCHGRIPRCIGIVVFVTMGLGAVIGWSQDEPDTSFEAEHEAAAELILPGLLAEVERDPMALDLLLRLPVPVRSAAANVVQSLRAQGQAENDACDAVLVYLLKYGETNIRARAASGLSHSKHETAVPALIAALRDRQREVRLFACQALMFQKDANAADAVAALLDDEAADVRRTAVRTLGWLDARDKLPALRRLYERDVAADAVTWMYPDCFARLGDEELALRSARPLLGDSNWNARFFVVGALARLESRQVVPLLMSALPREMELELAQRQAPERTFRRMCEELDRRTKTEFGDDAAARMRWWTEHGAEYGVSMKDARPPEGFDDLARRFAAAAARRDAPRDERVGSYFNLGVTYSPVEAEERVERAAWSKPVNGLRARLFARPRYERGENVQVMLMLECTGSKGVEIPGAAVYPIARYVVPGGLEPRRDRMFDEVLTAKELMAPGTVRMYVFDISSDPRLEIRVMLQRIDAPSHHDAHFEAPPRPGKYTFRAVFSPAGLPPDGLGDGSQAEEYPEWKSKRLVTPPIEIEIVGE